MSFDQGLSGLSAASEQLSVIGNNIANASTVGYKASDIQFSDVYANSLGGGGAAPVGIGVSSSAIAQQFTQGSISTDNNPLDIAINGNGFFQLSTNGTVSYTRSGQFHLDANGAIVTANGSNVQGYNANTSGVLSTGSTTNLVINAANLPPKVTSTVQTQLNLDSTSVKPINAFNATDPTTYNYSNSVTVYDSLGNTHALQTYYVQNGVSGVPAEDKWNVFATLDGTQVIPAPPVAGVPAGAVGQFSFNASGALDSATSILAASPPAPANTIALAMPLTNGANALAVNVGFTGATQYGTISGVNSQIQDGYASGQLTQFSAGANGIITGTYSNGETQTLGQVVLDNFVNPGGLKNAGNNQWYASAASGTPLLGTPGSGSLGTLQSSAVENSTTDLTSELVNMITAQQNYQANAQTIKSQDQITQTLVTLR